MFIAIAEAASFTRAAEELLLSQSSLTVTIRQLEEELGITLLNRTTRRVNITPDGEKFLREARRITTEFDHLIAGMHLLASQQGGTVRIAVLPSVAIRLMPDFTAKFGETHDNIQIQLRDDNARGLHRQVRENEVDFGISNKWYDYPELEYVPLVQDSFGLVCRKDDPLADEKRKGQVQWSEIDPKRLFIMAADTGIYTALKETPELEILLANAAGEVLVMVTLLEMVRVGLGVTVVPELAKPSPIDTDLVFVPLAQPIVRRELCLIRRRNEPLSTGAQKVWNSALVKIPKAIR